MWAPHLNLKEIFPSHLLIPTQMYVHKGKQNKRKTNNRRLSGVT